MALVTVRDSPNTMLSEYFHLPEETGTQRSFKNQVEFNNEKGLEADKCLSGYFVPVMSPDKRAIVNPGAPPDSKASLIISMLMVRATIP